MRSLYPNVCLRSVKYSDEETYLEHPVTITYKFDIPHYATVSDREVIVTPLVARGLFTFAMRELYYDTSIEKRDYPFSDRCSRQVILYETMSLPAGYTSAKMPKQRHLNGQYISFDGGYKFENNKFVFRENIRLGKRIYEASDWPAYRIVVENQKFFQNTPLIVVKPTL
jgi:hypothetical protein